MVYYISFHKKSFKPIFLRIFTHTPYKYISIYKNFFLSKIKVRSFKIRKERSNSRGESDMKFGHDELGRGFKYININK